MEKSGDRRIRKTKEALKNSLLELIIEKPINKITVKELVDTADLNRSTFYKYYADIPDMVEKIENEVYSEILNIIQVYIVDKRTEMDIHEHALGFIEELCVVIKNNSTFFKGILSKNGDIVFLYKIEELIEEYTIEQLKELLHDKVNNLQYIYSFFKSGCLGILKRWLNEGCKESAKEIAEMTYKFGEGLINSCRI